MTARDDSGASIRSALTLAIAGQSRHLGRFHRLLQIVRSERLVPPPTRRLQQSVVANERLRLVRVADSLLLHSPANESRRAGARPLAARARFVSPGRVMRFRV
jgi:hypothetical protein